MKLFDVYPLYEVTPVRAKDVYVYDNNDIEFDNDKLSQLWGIDGNTIHINKNKSSEFLKNSFQNQ